MLRKMEIVEIKCYLSLENKKFITSERHPTAIINNVFDLLLIDTIEIISKLALKQKILINHLSAPSSIVN